MIQETTRQRVLEAARRVLKEQPFQAMTMEQIAQEAQLSRRTVYNLFSNREEIYRASREQLLMELSAALEQVVPASASARSALIALATHVTSTLAADRHMEVLRSIIRDGPGNQWLRETYQRRIRTPLLEAIELILYRAREQGGPQPADVRAAALEFMNLVEASVVLPRLLDEEQDEAPPASPEQIGRLVDRFLANAAVC